MPESKNSLFPVVNTSKIDELFSKLSHLDLSEKKLKRLEIMVAKLWQAKFVDENTALLLKYSIIEIAKGGTSEKEETFDIIGKGKEELSKNSLNLLRDYLIEKDFNLISNGWMNRFNKMIRKPMKSPLEDFLKSKKINLEEFPFPFKKIKKVRDDLTHGSISSIKDHELQRANAVLYRISIGLILSEFQIPEWEELVDFSIN